MNNAERCCTKCGESKPLSDFRTRKSPKGTPRPDSACRRCHYLKSAQWVADNPEKNRQCHAAWRARQREARLLLNPPKVKVKPEPWVKRNCEVCGRNIGKAGHSCPPARTIKSCSKCGVSMPIEEFPKRRSHNGKQYPSSLCKPCTSARAVAWKLANPEKRKAISDRSAIKRLELHRAESRAYTARNPEKSRERSRAWIERNPELRKKIAREYAAAHPEKCKEQWHNRRARIKGGGGKHTPKDIQELFAKQRGKCANRLCGVVLGKWYAIDHVMPLALGGTNDPANLQLLCRKCNSQKNAKHPDQWARETGVLFV